MKTPLIELKAIRKSYGSEESAEILHGIDLAIYEGEFVAIIGASGSGKSTLMHIMGCLDQPSSGTYRFNGRDVSTFSADELAWLRREAFGFVFQSYHLINALDVSHNVRIPAVYADVLPKERAERADRLLGRLGLLERASHYPSQLSGGQQQRVSIARALINGGHVILADEPTGALDSQSGAEVMSLLKELSGEGHTIILITHDPQVAKQAKRVVRISDGRIVEDKDTANALSSVATAQPAERKVSLNGKSAQSVHLMERKGVSFLFEVVSSAWRTLYSSLFRTVLTLLGIVIGVASVMVLMAVGQGTSEKLLKELSNGGDTNRISIRPGFDNTRGIGGKLFVSDVDLIRRMENVANVSPFQVNGVTLRAGNIDLHSTAYGVNSEAPDIFNWKIAKGVFFNPKDEQQLSAVVVISGGVSTKLFGAKGAVGHYVLIDNVPFLIVGELAQTQEDDDSALVAFPFSTASRRLWGEPSPDLIQVRVEDSALVEKTIEDISDILTKAHRVKDFAVANNPARVRAQQEANQRQNLLLALIAGISLIVGGVGVMNIMLMAVKERMREIGIRMAVGARQRDIRFQFLSEAVIVSLTGGMIGIVIGFIMGAVLVFCDVALVFSIRAILLAFGCAVTTGLIFGYMPAVAAAKLNPVKALGGE
jgi:macrolide transport system ATP-binding/permease protein